MVLSESRLGSSEADDVWFGLSAVDVAAVLFGLSVAGLEVVRYGIFFLTFPVLRMACLLEGNGGIDLAIFGALGRMCAVFRKDQWPFIIFARCVAHAPNSASSIYELSYYAASQRSRRDVAMLRASLREHFSFAAPMVVLKLGHIGFIYGFWRVQVNWSGCNFV